jgi:hypothetical protein
MQFFLVTLLVLIMNQGCSDKTNAFDMFKMDAAHEKAMSYTRSASVVRSFETETVISTIYLNKVLPKEYHDSEYFFVALYLKNDKRLYYKDGMKVPDYSFKMNSKSYQSIELLEKNSKLRQLMPINNEWNRYYLVKFNKSSDNTLKLILENDQSHQAVLTYQKDDE